MPSGVPRYQKPESPQRPRFPSSLLFSSSSWLTSNPSTAGDTNLERNPNSGERNTDSGERNPKSGKLTFFNRILKFVGIRRPQQQQQQQLENFERKFTVSIFTTLLRRSDLYFLEKDDFVHSFEFIGRGGSGEVYKTEIPNYHRKLVAIKKITVGKEKHKSDAIRSEISTVGRIRHRNLVPLLAHVATVDCHFLIYDFIENGSLEEVLQRAADGCLELDWPTRQGIAMGIANGLEYLHFDVVPKIIHRDLKPSNVLLDCDMVAKITDFGLAVEEPDIESTRIAGTYGYMAPEYLQKNTITIQCDMYTYGVILAILVSGKYPTDNFFVTDNYISYAKWLRDTVSSENPTAAMDPKLIGNGYEKQMLMVLKIASLCTSDDPGERPNSIDAGRMLSRLQHY